MVVIEFIFVQGRFLKKTRYYIHGNISTHLVVYHTVPIYINYHVSHTWPMVIIPVTLTLTAPAAHCAFLMPVSGVCVMDCKRCQQYSDLLHVCRFNSVVDVAILTLRYK